MLNIMSKMLHLQLNLSKVLLMLILKLKFGQNFH